MQISGKRLRDKEVDIIIESIDDLWYLQKFVHPGDVVKGEANRKVQINDKGVTARKQAVVCIQAQTVDVDLDSKVARVNGTILQGNEWFPQGSFQNVTLAIGSLCTIIKEWDQISIQQIEQACAPQYNVLFILFDRDNAIFMQRKGSTYEIINSIQSDLDGKYTGQNSKSKYFDQIQETLTMQDNKLDLVCVGAPAFFHNHKFQSKTKQVWFDVTELTAESCSRMLRDKQVVTILKNDVTMQLSSAIEKIKQGLARNEKVCYGKEQVIESCNTGAVETLLITEQLITEDKEFVNQCMQLVEACKGNILIVPDKTDEHKMVQGLGGSVGVTRY